MEAVRHLSSVWAQVKLLSSLALLLSSLAGGLVATLLSPRLAYFATSPPIAISLEALSTFREPHLHRSEGRTTLPSHLRTISQILFQRENPAHRHRSMAFVLFALIFGVVRQHAGVFRAGWMVVGVVLLAGALLVTAAIGRDFKASTAADTSSSSCGFCQN